MLKMSSYISIYTERGVELDYKERISHFKKRMYEYLFEWINK